jgi:hypothetical protein
MVAVKADIASQLACQQHDQLQPQRIGLFDIQILRQPNPIIGDN